MRFISLTMATGRFREETPATDHSGEDDMDDLPATRVEITQPVSINVDNISHFYPRKSDRTGSPRQGTRIMLKTSAAIPVLETIEQVQALLAVH